MPPPSSSEHHSDLDIGDTCDPSAFPLANSFGDLVLGGAVYDARGASARSSR